MQVLDGAENHMCPFCLFFNIVTINEDGDVLDPSKGVCADPVERVAILEVKGPGPQVGSVSVS